MKMTCYRKGSLSLSSTVSRCMDYFGSTDYLIIFQEKELGARGSVTAFARLLVSEPYQTLGCTKDVHPPF